VVKSGIVNLQSKT